MLNIRKILWHIKNQCMHGIGHLNFKIRILHNKESKDTSGISKRDVSNIDQSFSFIWFYTIKRRTVGRLCSAPPPYLKFRPLFFGLYCSKTLQKHGFLLIFDIESLFYACNCTQNHYSRVQKYYTRGLMTKNDKLETYPMWNLIKWDSKWHIV